MKSIIKYIIITFSSILALIFLVIACGHSYFYIGFPPRKNGIERLNSVAHVKFSDRVVYFGNTGGLDDWQDYFKFNATKEEVEIVVLQLELEKTKKWINIHPSFYWWSAETKKGEVYFKDLGSSKYYLHYNPTNNEVHFADIHL